MEKRKEEPFWIKKSLGEMTREEWESLCDGCGKCCLEKLEDEETGQVYYTSVSCKHLDSHHCKCTAYENRKTKAPECLFLDPESAGRLYWLPATCAYKLIAQGKELKWWHHLISGDPETVHEAGVSVRYKCISEKYVDPNNLEAYILDETFWSGEDR